MEILKIKISTEVGDGYSWGHPIDLPADYVENNFEEIGENLKGYMIEQLRAAHADHIIRQEKEIAKAAEALKTEGEESD